MPKRRLKQGLARIRRKTKKVITEPTQKQRRAAAERQLINAESALGRSLFGEIAEGHQREFFCLQKNVWIWYEDGRMIRYEVRPDGLYKKVDEGGYNLVTGTELENFRTATKAYLKVLKMHLYKDNYKEDNKDSNENKNSDKNAK